MGLWQHLVRCGGGAAVVRWYYRALQVEQSSEHMLISNVTSGRYIFPILVESMFVDKTQLCVLSHCNRSGELILIAFDV